ncbi:MAG: nitroreductase family protein [Acidimicrobiales bacterium]
MSDAAPSPARPTPPPAADAEVGAAGLVAHRYAFAEPDPAHTAAVAAARARSGRAGPGVIEQMLAHRSCRRYTGEPVDDALLDVLLAAAFSAPSKSDLQQCSVIVVDDPGRRQAVAELIPTMPWILDCGRFLLFCADSRRIRRVADRAGVPFANDHLDAVLNAAADAAIHLASFIWAAESVGLGTCPISVVRNHIEAVAAIVELPEQVFPLAGMCVGWPERLLPFSPRLPPAVTVHRDRYRADDGAEAEAVDGYSRRRSAAGRPVPPDQQLDVDIWGVADPYGWAEEKARMVARRERDQLARFLGGQGFGLG